MSVRGIPFIDGLARFTCGFSTASDRLVDRTIVDGFVNWLAERTYAIGAAARRVQTGSLRQYVMFIAIGGVAVLLLIVALQDYLFAG